jgi:hypothetical protein
MNMIMRVTLHHGASNTYYGQWPRVQAAVCGLDSPAIVHNGPPRTPDSAALSPVSEIRQQIAR